MNLLFLVLTGINLIVFFYTFLKDLQIIIVNKTFKKVFAAGAEIGKKIEGDVKEQKGKANKTSFVIGIIIAIILLFGLYGAVIYLPIFIGLKYNLVSAISVYLLILIFTTCLRLLRYSKKENSDPKLIVLISLIAIFRFQVIIVILFGFKFDLSSMVETVYGSTFFLSNTIAILMPTLFFSSIILTIYLYWMGLKINSKLNIDNKFKPKLAEFLLILVVSFVAGLIYLFEMNLNAEGNVAFDRLLNLFVVILASILIPSLLSIFKKNDLAIKMDH